MEDLQGSLDALKDESYRVELLGELMGVEAREVRDAVDAISARSGYLIGVGLEFDYSAKVDAISRKLGGDVETEIRYRVDMIRELGRTLRHLADA